MINQIQLKELFTYSPDTGMFIRRTTKRHWKAGTQAGSLNKVNGYVEVWADGKSYTAHRLAFLYMYGRFPAAVDHADLNRSNNIWINLREASQQQNMWNIQKNSRNTSGFKGVSKRKDTGRFTARAKQGDNYVTLGCFDSAEEAHTIYQRFVAATRGEYARA